MDESRVKIGNLVVGNLSVNEDFLDGVLTASVTAYPADTVDADAGFVELTFDVDGNEKASIHIRPEQIAILKAMLDAASVLIINSRATQSALQLLPRH